MMRLSLVALAAGVTHERQRGRTLIPPELLPWRWVAGGIPLLAGSGAGWIERAQRAMRNL